MEMTMKRAKLLLILFLLVGISSYAQKMSGFGAELSVLSFKPNLRMWFSKTTGAEIFAGQSSELNDFKPNDVEAGFKFLHVIMYNRTDRTYVGVVGKWKWINVYGDVDKTSLPIPGILIGKEWYSKRINRKGFAVELGYQYGVKSYGRERIGETTFEEFPLILNLRYSFYRKK